MRLAILILLFPVILSAQIWKGNGFSYVSELPTHDPGMRGAWVVVDTLTGQWYERDQTAGIWREMGARLQATNTYGVPSYTPTKQRGRLAINSGDSLYYYQSGTWTHINAGGSVDLTPYVQYSDSITTFVTPSQLEDSLANKVSGSGTANYLAKFNSVSNIVNSQIQDNGSEIGIGVAPVANTKVAIRGPGTTNVTSSFVAENSAGSKAFEIQDNLDIRLSLGGFTRLGASVNAPRIYPGDLGTPNYASGTTAVWNFPTGSTTSGQSLITFQGNLTSSAAGSSSAFRAYVLWQPSSGSHTFTNYLINNIINQTGTANGTVIGFDYNPTLTSVLGSHYGLLVRSGQVGVGTGTPAASSLVDITSTTQGFLPPRLTTVQRDAIASPANGLIIFCSDCTATDGSTGVSQTYSSSAWRNHY